MTDNYVYGSSNVDGSMFINVPLIWKDSADENRFIINFSKVLHHEILHSEIYDAYCELGIEYSDVLYEDGEECVVRKLSKTVNRYLR